jgi:hypothetical protein
METHNKEIKHDPGDSISAEEALQLFNNDPIGFINEVVSGLIDYHSGSLSEQMALQNALMVAQKTIPEFRQFEPYILKELADLIASDSDGILEPWPIMIEKAVAAFKERFAQMAKDDQALTQELMGKLAHQSSSAQPISLEASGTRTPVEVKPHFTRKDISSMSMEEFLTNESAINQALKERRVK